MLRHLRPLPPRRAALVGTARGRIAFAGGARECRQTRAPGPIEGDRVERLTSGIDWAPPPDSVFQRRSSTGSNESCARSARRKGDTVIGTLRWVERTGGYE